MINPLTNLHSYIGRLLLAANVGVRLFVLMGLATSVALLLGGAGMLGLAASNKGLRSLYEGHIPSVQQLSEMIVLMQSNKILLLTALNEIGNANADQQAMPALDPEVASRTADAIEKNIDAISSLWRVYTSSQSTAAQGALAHKFAHTRRTFVEQVLRPAVVSLRTARYKETKMLSARSDALFEQANTDLRALIQLEFENAHNHYADGIRRYENMRLLVPGVLGMAILTMSWLGLILTRSIVNPLKQVIAIFKNISNSQYDTAITTEGGDEISEVLLALEEMQTKLNANEDAIHKLAFYDPLTNLPNRRLLHDRLQRALSASKSNHLYGALLMIDLDNFKRLNDTRGHDIGDLLLQEVALRVQSCIRQADTVARLGGDEFILILADLSPDRAQAALRAQSVGEKILAAISQPCTLANRRYHNTASMGLCLFLGQSTSLDNLLKHADSAMYQAKNNGRNALRFFDATTQNTLETHVTLEHELHEALPGRQFQLHYQIQMGNMHEVLGAEVLLRWKHPRHGMVSPDQFIPIAEESGLIVPIGAWVLRMACLQLGAWAGNPATEDFSLSVNVSARQFRQPDFVAMVEKLLEQTGINPARLGLELTESLVLNNLADAIDKMTALNRHGIHFSMDDFGTGYSSLTHLARLPIQQLKIDRSFVHNITSSRNDAVIVQTIIGMGNSLGLAVIAEGVETEEQRAFLEQSGCRNYQGYLYGRPMPLREFETLALEFITA